MRKILAGTALAVFGAVAIAQSPLTTIYTGGNGLGGGTAVYFDLNVAVSVQVTQLDVSALGGTGASSIEFWTCPTTWVGNDTNPSAWTMLGSSASVTAMPQNTPTVAAMTASFLLGAGSYGVAVVYRGTLGPSYTNGTGTNQTYTTAEMTLQAGASGGIFTGAVNNPRVWNGSIHYLPTGSGTVATKTNFGTGCVSRDPSFYEWFTTTPSIDLSNTAISMINNGAGYIVLPGVTTFVAPSGSATNLGLTDDSETTITLAGSFPYPGGSTTTLNVCSNGHISTASNGAAFDYTPTPAELLGWLNTTWAVWRDMIPSGTANVFFEEVGSISYVTWNGVVGYVGTATGVTPSTFQFQFDRATGNVHLVFLSLDTVSISTWAGGEGWIVGFSPAGASADPGSIDLSTALPLTQPYAVPLALAAATRPLAATVINLDTSNIPAGTPFGAIMVGLSNPALDLTGIGMPGCTQYTDGLVTLLFVAPSATNTTPFAVPNLVGLTVLVQSVVYCPAAGLTPLGAIASNGVSLLIGNL